jgi:hypothetical protein
MPLGNLLIHMYHPFDPAISSAVFERLAAIQDLPPRRVIVAYLTYTQSVSSVAEMFAASGWLRLLRYEESIRGRYNWLFYEGTPTAQTGSQVPSRAARRAFPSSTVPIDD